MQKVEISRKTIVFSVFFIIFLYFLWIIKDLLFSLLIAFILMSALKPAVKILEAKRIPKKIAALIIYLSFIFVFVSLFSIIIPPIITESTALFKNLPAIIKTIVSPEIASFLRLESLTQYLPNATQQVFAIVGNVFSNVFFVVTTLFFGFYFIIEGGIVKRFITKFLDDDKTTQFINVFERAEGRMSAWFWGQITLMLVVGALTFIGLNLIGMKYALALAVLAGLLEVVPNFGPILSAVPAFLIGLSMSYFMGFTTLVLYIVVQQLENNLIVPWIMKRAVGLDPIVTLITLIVGGKIGGILGVLLAIPLLLFVETLILEIRKDKGIMDRLR